MNVASLSNDVSKVRNQIVAITQKVENEIMQNKKGSEELHSCTSALQRQMETAKTQLKDISVGMNEWMSNPINIVLMKDIHTSSFIQIQKHWRLNILEMSSASISHEKHRKDEADHIKSIKSLLANSVAYIKDNLNVLDASVQGVIRKIDSNQASIVDLSKYHKLN